MLYARSQTGYSNSGWYMVQEIILSRWCYFPPRRIRCKMASQFALGKLQFYFSENKLTFGVVGGSHLCGIYPMCCVFFKHGFAHAFKCLDGFAHLHFLCETPTWHFGLLAPRNTWCGNAWFGEQVSSKYATWYSRPLCNLFELTFALVSFRFARYTVLTSPNKDETAIHGYGLTFIGSVVMLVSRKAIFFYVVFRGVARIFSKGRTIFQIQ